MTVLVTGAAGFIGSRLCLALLEAGHKVRGVDNFLAGRRENIPAGMEFVDGDIRDDALMARLCSGVEVVYHQAARRSVVKSFEDPVLTDDCNVRGTLTTLIAAHGAGVRRVVYASSSSIYGDPAQPLRSEEQMPRPVSPYGASKLAGELYCGTWTALHGLSTVSLRYFNVFGPGQDRESRYSLLFPAFVDALCTGVAPQVDWDGEQSRDFTFIDDIVAANLAAAAAGPDVDGQTFNIGGGTTRTVMQVLRDVSSAVGTWIDPVHTPKRPGDVRHTLADIAKAGRVLGWKPAAEWPASVAACVEWFREHNAPRFT